MLSTLRVLHPTCFAACALLLSACLNSSAPSGTGQGTAPPAAPATQPSATAAGSPATPAPTGTIVSQAQPGFKGTVISGTIEYNGAAPPPGSTLYLALVKAGNDAQPQPCIDAERNPVNDQGQFYAQVACSPQAGDRLMFVLIIGPAADRNWHSGTVALPSDLTDVHLVAPS